MQPVPLPLDTFPEQLRRHVDPEAAPPLKLMAARGLVPAGPVEMLMVLHQLALDGDAQVADSARKALVDLPMDVLQPGIEALRIPAVLTGIARWRDDEATLELIIIHPRVEDELIVSLARKVSPWTADLIAENQVRLLRRPQIIESLYLNEQVLMSTVHRVVEFARRNDVDFTALPALRAMIKELEQKDLEQDADPERDGSFALFLQESLAEDDEEDRGAVTDIWDDDDDDDDEEGSKKKAGKKTTGNRAAQIDAMSLSEKIRLATLGSNADREFLIRHSNRLVHMAAVTSPKVQPKDIHGWASNRSLPDGVIAYIANHREYSRNYQIMVRLMNNPKMPIQLATRKIPQLNKNDLKRLQKNRNISPQIQRMAKAFLEQLEKKRR